MTVRVKMYVNLSMNGEFFSRFHWGRINTSEFNRARFFHIDVTQWWTRVREIREVILAILLYRRFLLNNYVFSLQSFSDSISEFDKSSTNIVTQRVVIFGNVLIDEFWIFRGFSKSTKSKSIEVSEPTIFLEFRSDFLINRTIESPWTRFEIEIAIYTKCSRIYGHNFRNKFSTLK